MGFSGTQGLNKTLRVLGITPTHVGCLTRTRPLDWPLLLPPRVHPKATCLASTDLCWLHLDPNG